MTFNTYDYDSASTYASLTPVASIILIENNTATNTPTTGVTVEDLEVNGAAGSATIDSCGQDYVGVDFQNASGTLTSATVSNVASDPGFFGCQPGGLAVYAYTGSAFSGESPAVAVTISDSSVTGYQKNGITCDDASESCTITDNTVTGIGPTDLTGQNGIQIAYGSVASVESNTVTGNFYTPGGCTDQNFFNTSAACGQTDGQNNYATFASGILVYLSSSSVTVSHNTLSGDQNEIYDGDAPATISDNTLTSAEYYGILLYGASDQAPNSASVTGNSIKGANVGVLVYDDNATVSANTVTQSNVSIEAETDLPYAYSIGISSNTGNANVSGALLGDVSSYQSGDTAVPMGNYTVSANSFTNVSSANPSSVPYGILISGGNVTVNGNSVTGFANGIAAAVGPAGNVSAGGNVISAASPTTGGNGLYVFAGNPWIQDNRVNGFAWNNGPSWWADSQATGLFVQCLNICSVEGNSFTDDSVGIAVQSYAYGPYPAPGWPDADPASNGPITVQGNTITNSNTFGMAFELNQEPATDVATPSISILSNTVDNTISGAVGLMVDQGVYSIQSNTFIGTTDSGSSGSTQSTCTASVQTASIEVTDACDSVTWANIAYNQYVDTSLYASLQNLTSGHPPYFAVISGEPAVFTETGLQAGTTWSVTVAGHTLSSDSNNIIFDIPQGADTYTVGHVYGYKTTQTGTISGGETTKTGQSKTVDKTVVFTFAKALISAHQTQGPIGATVELIGSSWLAFTAISLTFVGETISSCPGGGSLTTSATGNFTCTIRVPSDWSGSTVSASDSAGQTATTTFKVTALKITPSPTKGAPGTQVSIKGLGFSENTTVTLVFDGVTISSCTSGSLTVSGDGVPGSAGTFTCTFDVPNVSPGSVIIMATDAGGQSTTAKYTVT